MARAHGGDYRSSAETRRDRGLDRGRIARARLTVDLTEGYSGRAVRIALVSPYSWTYPGGVTRHIESLAGELHAQGHDPCILAPFDPDDALSRRMHRGARPQERERPERFVSLGRTVGLPANGAVSNIALSPHALIALRRELGDGGYDVVHLHEPVVPIVCWMRC